jgi:hypothetical protein
VSDQTADSEEPTADGPPDPFDVVLDEDFIRAATTKEASAHARMLEQKFRQMEAEHAEQTRALVARSGSSSGGSGSRAGASGSATSGTSADQGRMHAWPVRLLVMALVGLVTLTVIEVWKMQTGQRNPLEAPSASANSTAEFKPGSPAIIEPSLDPSRAALVNKPWPAITIGTSFPDAAVHLGSNLVLDRVSTAKQVPCDTFASQSMTGLIDQGSGCSQLITALYTTTDDKAQFTVDVLTMNRAEDAGTVFGLARTMSLTYQMGSMDPPVGSKLPTVPLGNAGVTNCVMAVRSVVFVNAQWVDPSDQDVTTLTSESNSLLTYVDDKVANYEQAQARS